MSPVNLHNQSVSSSQSTPNRQSVSAKHCSILDTYFTVYRTEQAVELHPGCEDYEHLRVICTCVEYEQAFEIAGLVANLHHLPIKNFVNR